MCVRIETPDIAITVDPAASIEPDSFPLSKRLREELVEQYLSAVAYSCARSRAIVISHYHLDHFIPSREPELYGGKVLFCKDPSGLPASQQQTARRFFASIDGLPSELVIADGRRFRFGRTEVGFSTPMWHGEENANPGHVIVSDIKLGPERVVIASDVAGPTVRSTTDYICRLGATHVILDGYPTYQRDRFATNSGLVRSLVNVCRILGQPGLKSLVVDHHLARDPNYPALFELAYQQARILRKAFGTAAELAGKQSTVLSSQQSDAVSTRLDLSTARNILSSSDAEWLADFDRWVQTQQHDA